MSMTRRWSLLAALLIAGILAASWFLLVSPKRSEAADLHDQAVQQAASNVALVQQLNQLKAESLDLPKQQAKLAVYRTRIPDNPALPTLIRELTAASTKVGVEIDSMSPGTPTLVAGVVTPVVATGTTTTDAAATDSTTTDSATTDSATAASATPAPAASALYEVPVKLEVSGSYFEVEQFVNKLEGLRRSFLVTGFVLTTGDSTAATATGTADTSTGGLTLSLDGKVFLAPAAPANAATAPSATAPATAQAN